MSKGILGWKDHAGTDDAGPRGPVEGLRFDPKSNREAQMGVKRGNAMIRFMFHRVQEWTQRNQIRDSPQRSCKNIASSLQPSVGPALALITFHHHHLLSV